MRSILRLTLVLGLLATAGSAQAAPPSNPSQWALGFMLGEPTGITAKHWLGGPNAIDFGLGVGPGLRFHGDYLFGLARLSSDRSLKLDLYGGLGAAISTGRGYCGWWRGGRYCHDGDPFIGLRVPFGLDFLLSPAPLELGFEIAPGLWIGDPGVATMLDVLAFVRFRL